MDKADIYIAWARWMHRNDLSADLDTVWTFATSKIRNRLMLSDPDEVLANSPEIYLHAGLVYLADLAQDDAQLEREQMLFSDGIANYMMAWSLSNTTPAPQPESS